MNQNPFGGGFRPSGPQTPGLEGGFASAVAATATRTDSPGPSAAQLPAGGGSTGLGGGNRLLLSGNAQNVTPEEAANAGSESEHVVFTLVVELLSPVTREGALLELSKKREQWDDLALVLWHSFGVMSALLQEIVAVYPLLSPPSLTAHASNRVCNALALLQCVASHNETRSMFLSAHIPLFLYPFLNTRARRGRSSTYA